MIDWLYRWAPSGLREVLWKRERNRVAFRYASLGYQDAYTRASAETRDRWADPRHR